GLLGGRCDRHLRLAGWPRRAHRLLLVAARLKAGELYHYRVSTIPAPCARAAPERYHWRRRGCPSPVTARACPHGCAATCKASDSGGGRGAARSNWAWWGRLPTSPTAVSRSSPKVRGRHARNCSPRCVADRHLAG